MTESNLPCRILYTGNGVLTVRKPVPGAPGQYDPEGAHFAQVKLQGGRMYSEYVPGYAGLSFDPVAWEAFIKGAAPTVELTWPAWTCDDYEQWRADSRGDGSTPMLLQFRSVGTVSWCNQPPAGVAYTEHLLSFIDRLLEAESFLSVTSPVTLFCGRLFYEHCLRSPFSRMTKGGFSLTTLNSTSIWPLHRHDGLGNYEALMVSGDDAVRVVILYSPLSPSI